MILDTLGGVVSSRLNQKLLHFGQEVARRLVKCVCFFSLPHPVEILRQYLQHTPLLEVDQRERTLGVRQGVVVDELRP